MKRTMTIGVFMLATAAFGLADSWTGKLIDATCKPDPNTSSKDTPAPSCAPTSSTKVFAVQTPDGKVFRLDNAGNMKAAAALKDNSTKTSVTISGSLDGQMVKVDSIDLR